MTDESFLDSKYFVNSNNYNCPFCNRRHVSFVVVADLAFDWTKEEQRFLYIVKCASCKKRSMHLSQYFIEVVDRVNCFKTKFREFSFPTAEIKNANLDDLFFYSVPTSFFALDERIPRILRNLVVEAEGCHKGNFLTGASACARKIVYELAHLHGKTDGNYDDRIKSLKKEHSEIDGTYFDTLLTIQKATSSKVHENAYDGWEARHVRLILSALCEILHQLYVAPALRDDRRKRILELQKEVLGDCPGGGKTAGTELTPKDT